jgi:hypothetical protein
MYVYINLSLYLYLYLIIHIYTYVHIFTFTDGLISTTEDYGDEREDMIIDEERDDEDSSDHDMDFTQQKKIKLSPSNSNEKVSKSKVMSRDSSSSSGAKSGRLHKSNDKIKNHNGKMSRGSSSKKSKDSDVVDLTRGDDANEITPDSDDDDDDENSDDSMDAFVDDSNKRRFSGDKAIQRVTASELRIFLLSLLAREMGIEMRCRVLGMLEI